MQQNFSFFFAKSIFRKIFYMRFVYFNDEANSYATFAPFSHPCHSPSLFLCLHPNHPFHNDIYHICWMWRFSIATLFLPPTINSWPIEDALSEFGKFRRSSWISCLHRLTYPDGHREVGSHFYSAFETRYSFDFQIACMSRWSSF